MMFSKQDIQEMKEARLRSKALIKVYQSKISKHKHQLTEDRILVLEVYIFLNERKIDVLDSISERFHLGLS